MEKPNERLLYNFEMFALILSWLTFWGGLLFFLGKEKEGSVSETVKVLITYVTIKSAVSDGYGGALHIEDCKDVDISHVMINSAHAKDGHGGGIYVAG